MLFNTIQKFKNRWLESSECTIKELLHYIKERKALRVAQIEAIEIYLFLKIKGENKPLWELFAAGFFINNDSLDGFELALFERGEIKKLSLYNFAKKDLPSLAKAIQTHQPIDYEAIMKQIFYGVNYSDYLLSLPMGAGKTYLMASFIYLDLHFAAKEPENKNFAHNFLILIPSGLKNSIAPSLKSIASFDGSWVLPKNEADAVKKILQFDVLDVPKTAKKSNLANNPNAAKVLTILPNPFGQVFVVNAEKVILDGKLNELFSKDEIVENELKQKIALIPNLSILIDEVHHAASDEIKLRQVVSWWNEKGNITTVLGFSGTPYLNSPEKIFINEVDSFRFSTITNTVYYYPLTTAIEKFLKLPMVKSANLEKKEILTQAINDFDKLYKTKVYEDGTIAKCAIYCSSIEDLETVVYPHLLSLHIPKEEILKFHKGNKEYKVDGSWEFEFRMLDFPSSQKRYILLVQVGKEGWDCRSLTSVILSGSGDSPKNMVLQTSCRCLREVDKNSNTALIWLNESNAKILNEQLKKEQNSSIEEINRLQRFSGVNRIQRISRSEHLKLPKIDFYQLRIHYTMANIEKDSNTKRKLEAILLHSDNYKAKRVLIKSGDFKDTAFKSAFFEHSSSKVSFEAFLFQIEKNSFMQIDTKPYQKELQEIYNTIDTLELVYNDIALCFSIKREVHSKMEKLKEESSILIVENLKTIENNSKLYPSQKGVNQILEADANPNFIAEFTNNKKTQSIDLISQGKTDEAINLLSENLEMATKNKEKSFHYLPYNFKQSNLEKTILERFFTFNFHGLEIYYNGERGLSEFVIECFKKLPNSYKYIGRYTTDFLIIKRDEQNRIQKVLILETKGEGFANDEKFKAKKEFVDGEFIATNNTAFGYNKFDFLYLEDSKSIDENLSNLDKKITQFFKEN